jgi:hypothetical protein
VELYGSRTVSTGLTDPRYHDSENSDVNLSTVETSDDYGSAHGCQKLCEYPVFQVCYLPFINPVALALL